MRRRALLLAVILVALGVLVVALLRRATGGSSASGGPGARAGAAERPTTWPSPSVPQRGPVTLAPAPAAASSPAPQGAFEGRVVSARDGAPVPGAQLTFARAEEASAVAADADGAFRFAARVPGRWSLAGVTADGFLPFAPAWGASPVAFEARAGEVVRGVTVTLQPEVRYQGRVVDRDDRPVGGAVVRVLSERASEAAVPLRDTFTSGEDGRFTFAAPEEALLEARKPGFAPGRARVDYAARVSGRLTLRLPPEDPSLLAIGGVVQDGAGRPVAGAAVTAQSRRSRDAALAWSGPDGRFRLEGLAPGAWWLVAERAGFAAAAARARAGVEDVRLELRAGGAVQGLVRDRASGAPVPSFTLVVESLTTRTASIVDPAGRYLLDDLPPGHAVLRVVAPGRAPSAEERVEVPEPGEPAAVVDFELAPAGRLTGVVVERGDRRPVAGARIEVEGSPASAGAPVRSETVSGPDGSFQLEGASETAMSLFASAPDHHARVLSVAGAPGGETHGPVEIELTPLAPGEEPRVELAGIGAQLAKRGDTLRILGVLPGGGAAAAGLAPGDAVVAIDGVDVAPMTLSEAVPLLRGPEGTSVALTVLRGGEGQAVTVTVSRALVRG